MKRIVSIVGARPQFIKLAPVSAAIRQQGMEEIIIHTGQHFDENMSALFFEQMKIPNPDYNLNIQALGHGAQTGKMLIEIETLLIKLTPDMVVVFGDTNSTLAAALAAAKLHIPIIHIEAGLRSGDKKMPEEQNRIMTDHLSTYCACPSETAVQYLKNENLTENVRFTGDVMYDAALTFVQKAKAQNVKQQMEKDHHIKWDEPYYLMTVHRPTNTDNLSMLKEIMENVSKINDTVIFPIHPRTRKRIAEANLKLPDSIRLMDPVGYLEMLLLIESSKAVVTDSGGLQKEAFFLKTPCITLRDTTEWPETLALNCNQLMLSNPYTIEKEKFEKALLGFQGDFSVMPYGDGNAAIKIAEWVAMSESEITQNQPCFQSQSIGPVVTQKVT